MQELRVLCIKKVGVSTSNPKIWIKNCPNEIPNHLRNKRPPNEDAICNALSCLAPNSGDVEDILTSRRNKLIKCGVRFILFQTSRSNSNKLCLFPKLRDCSEHYCSSSHSLNPLLTAQLTLPLLLIGQLPQRPQEHVAQNIHHR